MADVDEAKIQDYFRKFTERKLIIEYFANPLDGQHYRVEFMPSDLGDRIYTFQEFYDEMWSKGYSKHVETASLDTEDTELAEEFFAYIGVESYASLS